MLDKDATHGAQYKVTASKALGMVSATVRKGAACSRRFDLFECLASFAQRHAPDHEKVFYMMY